MGKMPIQATYNARIPDTQDKSGELKHALAATQKHSFEQLDWLVPRIVEQWDVIAEQGATSKRLSAAEKVFHATKTRTDVVYPEYDEMYGYTPSYIRRSLFRSAIGHVSSYKSNHANWVAGGKQGDEPKLGKCRVAPTFFRKHGHKWDSALEKREEEIRAQVKARRAREKVDAEARGVKNYKPETSEDEDVLTLLDFEHGRYDDAHEDVIELNLFDGKTWKWYEVRLRHSDVAYINRYCAYALRGCPSLVKRGKNQWSLSFCFTFYQQLDDTPLFDRRILSVDLGVNNAACMVVMDWKGTVLARKFLRFASEEDHLYRMLDQIRRNQSENGSHENKRLWSTVNGINDTIANRTVAGILEMADMYAVHTIVLEHLDMSGRKRGSKTSRQRLHLWCVKRVQKMLEGRAHRSGYHISRVNAWGTSRLAFDGSGYVTRGQHIESRTDANGIERSFGYGTVEFSTGKLYAADLNAAYNIGARYFVREICREIPEDLIAPIAAEVPGVAHRSQCTLSSLWMLSKALCSSSTEAVAS